MTPPLGLASQSRRARAWLSVLETRGARHLPASSSGGVPEYT